MLHKIQINIGSTTCSVIRPVSFITYSIFIWTDCDIANFMEMKFM